MKLYNLWQVGNVGIQQMEIRTSSFGENYKKSIVDQLNTWLSTRRIVRIIKKNNIQQMADIGCGYNAEQARATRAMVTKSIIVDLVLDQSLINSSEFETYVGLLPHVLTEVPTHSLDLVVLNAVLEHLDDPIGALENIRLLLKPGGILFINVPSWLGKRVLEFLAFRLSVCPEEEMEDHRRYYNKRELWLELRRSGFLPSKLRIRLHKFGFAVFAIAKT